MGWLRGAKPSSYEVDDAFYQISVAMGETYLFIFNVYMCMCTKSADSFAKKGPEHFEYSVWRGTPIISVILRQPLNIA